MTIWLTFRMCGFGFDRDTLFPELRAGVLSIGWCRGAVRDRLMEVRHRATAALAALRSGGAL